MLIPTDRVSLSKKSPSYDVFKRSIKITKALYSFISSIGETNCLTNSSTADAAKQFSMPLHLLQLIILVEDKRYWLHPGIDPIALGRAFIMNIQATGRKQGGSTITEQLVKHRLKISARTLRARVLRALISIKLCQLEKKQNLLLEYLLNIYFGQSSYGVYNAALVYFNKLVKDLNPAESFFLTDRIALPNNFRGSRITNLLSRTPIQEVLGIHIYSIPKLYGEYFGTQAEQEITRVLSKMKGFN